MEEWKENMPMDLHGNLSPDAKALVEPLMDEFKKRDWI